MTYASDSNAAHDLSSEIGKVCMVAIHADAGSISGAERLGSETVKHFGKIDIFISNAHILPRMTLRARLRPIWTRISV